ncbi:MAG: hypothetical protein ACFB9M_05335 [Myxococcota bacterium]
MPRSLDVIVTSIVLRASVRSWVPERVARRTRPSDAQYVSQADDLEHVVKDKRASWRADASRARRRNRRYQRRLTEHLVHDEPLVAADDELS